MTKSSPIKDTTRSRPFLLGSLTLPLGEAWGRDSRFVRARVFRAPPAQKAAGATASAGCRGFYGRLGVTSVPADHESWDSPILPCLDPPTPPFYTFWGEGSIPISALFCNLAQIGQLGLGAWLRNFLNFIVVLLIGMGSHVATIGGCLGVMASCRPTQPGFRV